MRLLVICLTLLLYADGSGAQFLTRLCTLEARSGLAIQAVDADFNPVPFDCANTQVLVGNDAYSMEIKPGQYHWCPATLFSAKGTDEWRSRPVPVLGEQPGTYQVTVIRFDQVSTFREVVVPLDESGCHVLGKILEVNQQ